MVDERVFVFKPTSEVLSMFREYGYEVVRWEVNGDEEIIFEMDEPFYKNSFLRGWVEENVLLEQNETIISTSSPNEVEELIQSGKSTEEYLRFEDFQPSSPVSDIINEESPGGDVRKYISTLYGGCRFSIKFHLFGSRKSNSTSMEPLSAKNVRGLIAKGILSGEVDLSRQYLTAGVVLEWSRLLNDMFDVDCRGMGALYFGFSDQQPVKVGLDGFVIYNVNESVKKWVDESWNVRNPEFPFMSPYEYRSYNMFGEEVIRMWWD